MPHQNCGVDAALIAEQRLDVTAPAQHAQDQDLVTVNPVRNHVVTDDETAHTWSQVFVATTADVRLASEECEASRDRVDHAVNDVDVAALRCEEVPDFSSRSDSACGATRRSISATDCVPRPIVCVRAA
jgi:hypothetical protein